MSDGSRIQFIWNKSNGWQILSLTIDKKYTSSYWMNAEHGTITNNNGSIILFLKMGWEIQTIRNNKELFMTADLEKVRNKTYDLISSQ